MELNGQRAIVTGGTSGLGREIACTLAEAGIDLAILGRNRVRGAQVVEELRARRIDGTFLFREVDVGQTQEVESVVTELLGQLGGCEILVNCAGVTRDQLLMRMKEEDWDRVIDTNLKSAFNLCRALIRPMIKARRGKIVNIASVVGPMGNPGQTNYAASKMGLIGFTKSTAKELGSKGICVNAVAPGFFDTPMTQMLTNEQKKGMLDRIPMKRFGRPRELAEAVLFLCSDRASYITGQVLTVDGGMLA